MIEGVRLRGWEIERGMDRGSKGDRDSRILGGIEGGGRGSDGRDGQEKEEIKRERM